MKCMHWVKRQASCEVERQSQEPGWVRVQVNSMPVGVRANGWGGMSALRVAWVASSSRAVSFTFHFPLEHVRSLNLFYMLVPFGCLYSGILFQFSSYPLSLTRLQWLSSL